MEQWKDIKGYEGIYQVSDRGRIKSLRKKKYLKVWSTKQGYRYVVLNIEGKAYTTYIHQLIAQAFIPNPDNKDIVHHIDRNPENNSLDNLMWVTQQEHFAIHDHSKKVYQYTIEGKYVGEYNSLKEAEFINGFPNGSIGKTCNENNKRKSCYGYQWSFIKKEKLDPVETSDNRRSKTLTNRKDLSKPIAQYTYDLPCSLIKVWPSTMEIERKMGYDHRAISMCCTGKRKSAYGYQWSYFEE